MGVRLEGRGRNAPSSVWPGIRPAGLAEAREIAAANRRMVAADLNPLTERRKTEAVPTFKEAVAQVFLTASASRHGESSSIATNGP